MKQLTFNKEGLLDYIKKNLLTSDMEMEIQKYPGNYENLVIWDIEASVSLLDIRLPANVWQDEEGHIIFQTGVWLNEVNA